MKTKIIGISILFTILLTSPCKAATTPMQSWVNEDTKTVYFLPNPILKIRLNHLGADENYWDQLSIDFSYTETNPESNQAAKALEAEYPGYLFQRVLISGVEQPSISIPSLGMHESVEMKEAAEGPYYHQIYYIPKSKSDAVRAAYTDASFIALTGKVKFSIPSKKTVESIDLDSETCDQLTSSGNDLASVVQQYAIFSKQLDRMGIQYKTTKEALAKSVLMNCLDLTAPISIQSFRELLNLRIQTRRGSIKIHGETAKTVMNEVDAPFQYLMIREKADE